MASWIEQISYLNGKGASLLAGGKARGAAQLFREALEVLGYMSHSDHPAATATTTATVLGMPEWSPATAQPMIVESTPERTAIKGENSSAVTMFHFVYQKPFGIHSSPAQENLVQPILSAIILFNLALSYHIMSEEIGERALLQALKLYDLCLVEIQCAVQSAIPSDYLNVVVAAMNNMLAVSYGLCDYVRVNRVLRSLLQLASSFDMKRNSLQNFQEEDMQGLLMNIILLQAYPIAPAA